MKLFPVIFMNYATELQLYVWYFRENSNCSVVVSDLKTLFSVVGYGCYVSQIRQVHNIIIFHSIVFVQVVKLINKTTVFEELKWWEMKYIHNMSIFYKSVEIFYQNIYHSITQTITYILRPVD